MTPQSQLLAALMQKPPPPLLSPAWYKQARSVTWSGRSDPEFWKAWFYGANMANHRPSGGT